MLYLLLIISPLVNFQMMQPNVMVFDQNYLLH
ncbi:unnamed protein product [Schistosoma curassoni]|uniref:NADH dehydrogenase subunit 4L n=1 Tax=Schistosoma curassoni TaxID=6186 RepID=A0A183JXV7_9TREM|nr:unnamed protein product [Schistosoma curassoni]